MLMGRLAGGAGRGFGIGFGRRGTRGRRRLDRIGLLVLGLHGTVRGGVLLLLDLLLVGGGGLGGVVRDLVHHVLAGIPRERAVALGDGLVHLVEYLVDIVLGHVPSGLGIAGELGGAGVLIVARDGLLATACGRGD